MTSLLLLLVVLSLLKAVATAWIITPCSMQQHRTFRHPTMLQLFDNAESSANKFNQLMDMDIVLFSRSGDSNKQELGAMQEDGTIAPISVWTLEPAYDTALAFVVDEVDRYPGLTAETCEVIEILDENVIGYGSRQLFGGKGPGNPHGEESEQLYYVEQEVLESKEVEIVVKPELEIQW